MSLRIRHGSRLLVSLLSFVQLTAGVAAYACGHVGVLRRPAIRLVFYKQLLFTGIQALLPVTVAGLAVGIALVTQMRSLLGSGVELNVRMMQLVVLREFAPLLTSFIVLGRSGSAMATELAAMKVRGEVRTLYLLGIDPGEYLLVPRVIGCCLAVPSLTLVFQLVAAGVGPAVASMFVEIPLAAFYAALGDEIGISDFLFSVAKTTSLGMIIASVACSTGVYVPPRRTWIPQAAELSVLRGFILLLLTDLLFAAVAVLAS
jgi:phospholipid/cholesterol/gamma-HCH transport system permease protein